MADRRTKLPPSILQHFADQAIAMDPTAHETFMSADPQALVGFGAPRGAYNYLLADGVAVVPIYGTVLPRGSGVPALDALLGIVGLDQLQETLAAAAADGAAHDILLDIDSGGGPVAGMFEFATFLRKIDAVKPVTTFARNAMSAAYLYASATRSIIASETSLLGSVGVLGMRVDRTAQDEKQGVVYHIVGSGDAKGDGFEHKAVTESELERLRARVDDLTGLFFERVATYRAAAGRPLAVETLRGLQANVYRGDKAKAIGLADNVATFEDTFLELATRPDSAQPTRRSHMAEGSAGTVASIADHPEFESAQAAARLEGQQAAEQAAAERADEVSTLCLLAGHPEKIAEFLQAKTPIADVRAWARTEAAAAKQAGTVSGLHPAAGDAPQTALPPKPVMRSRFEIHAEREQILARARG